MTLNSFKNGEILGFLGELEIFSQKVAIDILCNKISLQTYELAKLARNSERKYQFLNMLLTGRDFLAKATLLGEIRANTLKKDNITRKILVENFKLLVG